MDSILSGDVFLFPAILTGVDVEEKIHGHLGAWLLVYLMWVQSFPGGSAGKESACNAGDLGSIPGLGRSPGEGEGYPLQFSGLKNSMDYVVHGFAKTQTRLSDFHFQVIIKLRNFQKIVCPSSVLPR